MIIEAPDERQKHRALVEKYAQLYVNEQVPHTVLKPLRREIKDSVLFDLISGMITMRANEIYRLMKRRYKWYGVILTLIGAIGLSMMFLGDLYIIAFGPLLLGPYYLFKGFSSYELGELNG